MYSIKLKPLRNRSQRPGERIKLHDLLCQVELAQCGLRGETPLHMLFLVCAAPKGMVLSAFDLEKVIDFDNIVPK